MNILVPLVHTLDRPFHALDRLFQGLSTVRSEIVHKLCLKISGIIWLFSFGSLQEFVNILNKMMFLGHGHLEPLLQHPSLAG